MDETFVTYPKWLNSKSFSYIHNLMLPYMPLPYMSCFAVPYAYKFIPVIIMIVLHVRATPVTIIHSPCGHELEGLTGAGCNVGFGMVSTDRCLLNTNHSMLFM